MARLNRPTETKSTPVAKYLNWKSNEKAFSYYDKEQGKNILVELPIKFLFLEHYHTVKGWNDASESGIYSNEVYSIGKEEMNVKAFKGGEIGSGLYKDIKERIKNAGAVYHRSIYAMNEQGEIINLQLKGIGVKAYSDFYNENNHLLDNQWIEINSAKDGKKGSIKFSSPEFTIGSNITKSEDKIANECADKLQSYMDSYFGRNEVSEDVETEEDPF